MLWRELLFAPALWSLIRDAVHEMMAYNIHSRSCKWTLFTALICIPPSFDSFRNMWMKLTLNTWSMEGRGSSSIGWRSRSCWVLELLLLILPMVISKALAITYDFCLGYWPVEFQNNSVNYRVVLDQVSPFETAERAIVGQLASFDNGEPLHSVFVCCSVLLFTKVKCIWCLLNWRQCLCLAVFCWCYQQQILI